jgi:hypothetical protein
MSKATAQALQRIDLPLEIKSVDVAQRIIEGYASVYSLLDLNGDIVAPGAFDETLAGRLVTDIKCFIGHDYTSLPVGVPLEVRSDARGLYTRTKILPTQAGDDLLACSQALQVAGSPLGMSIGFRTIESDWVQEEGQDSYRRVKKAFLGEYSYVAMPAQPAATVLSVKSQNGADLENKGAAAIHHTATDTESKWDGPKAMADCPNDPALLRYISAWVDSDGDAEAKSSYKLPHHMPSKSAPAIIAGVNNALARLSATQIPDGDKAAVEAHLRAHRKDAGLDEEKGADLALMRTAVALEAISLDVASEQMAMARLGIEIKAGTRMRPPMRARVSAVIAGLQDMLQSAEHADSEEIGGEGGDEGKAGIVNLDDYHYRLALLEA